MIDSTMWGLRSARPLSNYLSLLCEQRGSDQHAHCRTDLHLSLLCEQRVDVRALLAHGCRERLVARQPPRLNENRERCKLPLVRCLPPPLCTHLLCKAVHDVFVHRARLVEARLLREVCGSGGGVSQRGAHDSTPASRSLLTAPTPLSRCAKWQQQQQQQRPSCPPTHSRRAARPPPLPDSQPTRSPSRFHVRPSNSTSCPPRILSSVDLPHLHAA